MNSKTDRILKDLYRTLRQADRKRTTGYDTPAEVTRVDGSTVWVHIPGGVDETPVKMTMGAKKGDIVQVRVSSGSAWLIGNSSAPPTDDTRANQIGDTLIVTQTLLADTIMANNARFAYVEADTAKIHHLEADELEASVAYIHDLTADNITVQDLYATTGYIKDLAAENITAANIVADHATINTLDANYAHITNGVIDNAKIGYADVNDLNAHYAHISQGVIDNAKIGYADVNDLNAHYAQVDAANIDTAAIRNAWIDELMVQSGLIAHEGVIYELDAIQVNASKIKAGTLDVERLVVTQNGQKYLVHIDPSTGNPTYEKLDGNVIEDLTITADKIVAGAITAQKITTENISGSGGWINLRNGTFEYENATSGEGITWDGTNLTIRGSVSIVNSDYYTKTESDNLLSAKRQIFTSQPTNAQAYAVGDLWVNATYGTTYSNDILKCKTAKASGTAFSISHWERASGYTDDSNVYTKSDFSITPSEIISKVNTVETNMSGMYAVCSTAASTTAKVATITPALSNWSLYTGASITVKFTKNNTATAPTLNVNSTGAKRIYAYSGTSALTEAEYKWKAGDTITFFYDGSYWRIQDSTQLSRMTSAETSITQSADSIVSLASNTSTYTKPDGTTATNAMHSAIEQNAEGINTLIGRADDIDTLIRAYSGGVLTAKVGNTVGARVNSGGSFDIVPLTWSGNTPTVGSASLATFGTTTRIGAYASEHAYITSNGFSIYTASDAKVRAIFSNDNNSNPYAQLGSSQDSNYLYLSSSGLSVYSKASGEQSHSSGFFAGLDGTTPLTRIGRANDGHISVYPSGISVYKAGATANDDPVRVAYFGSEIRIGAQTARNIYITDTAVNFMNNGDDLGYISGTSARFGSPNSSRFIIGASSLQAYSATGLYFSVSASGITYGNNIAVANASDIPTKVSELTNDSSFATTTQVGTAEANAKKEATNYIYYVNSTDGIVIADASPSSSTRFVRINSGGVRLQQSANNYATMTSSGLTVYQGGAQVGYFGSASRIGSPNDGNIYVSSSGLNVYKKDTGDTSPISVAYFGANNGAGYSRIGESNERHIEVDAENGFCIFNADGSEHYRARDGLVRIGTLNNDSIRLVMENNYLNIIYRDSSGNDSVRTFIGYTTQDGWYSKFRGSVTLDSGSLYIPYQYSVYCKNSSGNNRSMVNIDGANCYFGYGAYNSSEGTTYYDGNNTTIRAKGNITFTAGVGGSGTISGNKAYTNTSDIRLKEDVEYLGADTDDIILNLKPFKFHWKDKEAFDRDDHYGISAQDLKAQLEEKKLGGIVSKIEEHYGVAYSELIPMLIHLCQSQQKEINELKEKIQ